LILDDFGLKPLEGPGPADLYDVINERYEAGSIVLTSNRAPAEWPDLFGNPLLASAGLDRLAHHAETLIITGTSFRARSRTATQQRFPGPVPRYCGAWCRYQAQRAQTRERVRQHRARSRSAPDKTEA